MDIKCKNCGQMIDENDKYCRYCGYLIPPKEEKKSLSKVAIEDKIQETKATITEEEIVGSEKWSFADLSIRREGDKNSICTKSTILAILLVFFAVMFMTGAILVKIYLTNVILASVLLTVFMLAVLVFFGFALERCLNTIGLKKLVEDEIVVRKYGFKKPAEVLINGHVFEVIVDKPCPVCEGEIIGDLHIEKIEKKIVVVCNINRKHCFQIDEKEFINAIKNNQINIVGNKKKSKKK